MRLRGSRSFERQGLGEWLAFQQRRAALDLRHVGFLMLNESAEEKIKAQIVVVGVDHGKAAHEHGAVALHDHLAEAIHYLFLVPGNPLQDFPRPFVTAMPRGRRIAQVHRE